MSQPKVSKMKLLSYGIYGDKIHNILYCAELEVLSSAYEVA